MKLIKTLLTVLFIATLSYTAHSQNGAVSITGGITQDGYAGVISYNYYWDRYSSDFMQGSVFLNFSEQDYSDTIKVPYNDFTVNLAYFKNIVESRSGSLKIAIGAGAVFGYEILNNGTKELDNGAIIASKSGFIYGAFLGLDTDIYLSDTVSVVLKANQYYHVNSDVGEFLPYVGTGMRIFLDF